MESTCYWYTSLLRNSQIQQIFPLSPTPPCPQRPKPESAGNKQWHAAWETSSKSSADQNKFKVSGGVKKNLTCLPTRKEAPLFGPNASWYVHVASRMFESFGGILRHIDMVYPPKKTSIFSNIAARTCTRACNTFLHSPHQPPTYTKLDCITTHSMQSELLTAEPKVWIKK